MIRFYLCTFRGDGLTPETAYRPALMDLGDQYAACNVIDMRPYAVIGDGYAFAWVDWSDPDHAAAIALPDVTYLAFEAGAVQVPLDSPLSAVDSANIQAAKTALEAAGVPTDGITLAMTVRQAMQIVLQRAALKRVMRDLDFYDLGMSTQLNVLPSLHLKAAKRALDNWGFDTSTLTASTTVRQLLVALMAQPNMDTVLANLGYSV